MPRGNLAVKEEYVSQSTIDRPPRDVGDDETEGADQQNLFETEDDLAALDSEPHERKWKVNLQLTLTADDGKPTRFCLVGGMCRGTVVMELVERAVKSRRNKQIIDAVLDNPKGELGSDVF